MPTASGGGTKRCHNLFCVVNLRRAWHKFIKGKKKRKDIVDFAKNLNANFFDIQRLLATKEYEHGSYQSFYVHDPKKRHIHKAEVRDRIIHQALVNTLEPIFEPQFIFDSYASRKSKGTHRAVKRLYYFARKASKNYKKNCFVLKCDIKKYFDSIGHDILLQIIGKTVKDVDILGLVESIIRSFEATNGRGLPLGNVTSQIFSNIYLNELDQFIKRNLRVKYYIRYNDDFVILDEERETLECYLPVIKDFLEMRLKLTLHPKKVGIHKYAQGIEFLGYVCLPHYILPKTRTKRRILKKIKKRICELERGDISEETFKQSVQSYFGFLSHAKTKRLVEKLKNTIWFWLGK